MIDAHVHLYDAASRRGSTELPSGQGLPTQALPEDLCVAAQSIHLEGVVAIEISRVALDDTWLLELSEKTDSVLAVIANMFPQLPGFSTRLAQARRYSKFRGLRLRPVAQLDLSSQLLRRNLSQLSDPSNVIEVGCPRTAEAEAIVQLAERLPDQNFVIDHFGHPRVEGVGVSKAWFAKMAALAACPNVSCKVTTAAKVWLPQSHSCVVMDCLVEKFGTERLLFGSNWPDCAKTSYPQTCAEVETLFPRTLTTNQGFWRDNAMRLYRTDHKELA